MFGVSIDLFQCKILRLEYSVGRLEPEYCRMNIREKAKVTLPVYIFCRNEIFCLYDYCCCWRRAVLWLIHEIQNAPLLCRLISSEQSQLKLSLWMDTELEKG